MPSSLKTAGVCSGICIAFMGITVAWSVQLNDALATQPIVQRLSDTIVASATVPVSDNSTANGTHRESLHGVVLERISIRTQGADRSYIHMNEQLFFESYGHYSDGSTQRLQSEWSIQNALSFLHHARHAHRNRAVLTSCTDTSICAFRTVHPGKYVLYAMHDGKEASVAIEVSALSTKARQSLSTVPSWARGSVEELAIGEIMRGYDDGSFGPADNLTQGQIMTLLTRALERKELIELPESCPQYSSNVPADHYAYRALCVFKQQGWEVRPEFKPDTAVSRAQTALYLYQIFGRSLLFAHSKTEADLQSSPQVFTDVPQHAHFFSAVAFTNEIGLMTGQKEDFFGASRSLNRAEAAVLLIRLLKEIEEQEIAGL